MLWNLSFILLLLLSVVVLVITLFLLSALLCCCCCGVAIPLFCYYFASLCILTLIIYLCGDNDVSYLISL